jgi:hypothetical protein
MVSDVFPSDMHIRRKYEMIRFLGQPVYNLRKRGPVKLKTEGFVWLPLRTAVAFHGISADADYRYSYLPRLQGPEPHI